MESPKIETPDRLTPTLITTIRQIAHNTRYHTSTRKRALEGAIAEIRVCLDMIAYEEVRLQEEQEEADKA